MSPFIHTQRGNASIQIIKHGGIKDNRRKESEKELKMKSEEFFTSFWVGLMTGLIIIAFRLHSGL